MRSVDIAVIMDYTHSTYKKGASVEAPLMVLMRENIISQAFCRPTYPRSPVEPATFFPLFSEPMERPQKERPEE